MRAPTLASSVTCRCLLRLAPKTQHRGRRTLVSTAVRFSQRGGASKLYQTADVAVADIKSGSTILSSGFGLCGVAGALTSPTPA